MIKTRSILVSLLIPAFFLLGSGCEESPLTDAQKLAALRKVKLQYDGMSYEIGFPEGALSGQSFAELLVADSSTYADPANYSVTVSVNAIADNTDPDAKDAKFDGMRIDLVMDDIESEPIQLESEGFEVPEGETVPIDMSTTFNLESHRNACMYIFRQTADGNELSTTVYPFLYYDIGLLEGEIPLLPLHKDIPTRADQGTKDFLRQLLDSGVFNE